MGWFLDLRTVFGMVFLGLLVVVGDRLRVVLASLRGGLAFPRREAGYSHLGDRSRSAGRRDIRTKPCFLMFFGSLGRSMVRVFGQRSNGQRKRREALKPLLVALQTS